MVREFVGRLGGGLVVLAGPRFGPGQLADTPLAEMLPVIVDARLSLRDERAFEMQRTLRAGSYRFMQLGRTPSENETAWDNLGDVPWYQPVAGVHQRAEVLAEHPSDTCRDGRTRQPLVAVRRFGEGEVVYLGFNEFWRLRRRYGERYYRRFWSPLIDRLGLSHALGSRKRFAPRLDRDSYRIDEEVVLTVQVFDRNYEPLAAEELETEGLEAEIQFPVTPGGSRDSRRIIVPLVRDGLGEVRFPVYTSGLHRIRVRDPLSENETALEFDVSRVSAEKLDGVRDEVLQRRLAARWGGRSYDLTTAGAMVDDMQLDFTQERRSRVHPLWSTPAWFTMLVALMLGEWLLRKRLRLI
jgi:hypothetical protein